jgi:hypothetical protein
MLTEKYGTEVCIYQHKRGKHVKVWYKSNKSQQVGKNVASKMWVGTEKYFNTGHVMFSILFIQCT